MREMTRTELAWLAGLLEGEGCFYLKWRGKGAHGEELYPTMCVQLAMTDEDIVQRAAAFTGVGKVRKASHVGVRLDGEPCKDKWVWWVGRREGCEDLMRLLLPFMGERRSSKIIEILAAGAANPARPSWRHGTRRGYDAGCRELCCREPHNARMRAQREKRKS